MDFVVAPIVFLDDMKGHLRKREMKKWKRSVSGLTMNTMIYWK